MNAKQLLQALQKAFEKQPDGPAIVGLVTDGRRCYFTEFDNCYVAANGDVVIEITAE